MPQRPVAASGVVLAYLGSVVAANWLIEHFGIVPVGFGSAAPAGVFAVGPALVLRCCPVRCWARSTVS